MRGVRYRSSERGATIVMIAVAMTALLSMVALAVDIGMLFNARSEAQRAADAAALAGAGYLIVEPGNEDKAREKAIEYGELNAVGGQLAVVLDEDVEVDLPNELVRVTVRRTASRGSAVPTWFARVFGTDAVDVAAVAAAKIEPAGRLDCAKPFTIPDLYDDVNDNGRFDEGDIYTDPTADPAPDQDDYTGYGSPYRNAGQPGDNGLGLVNDRGMPLIIKGGGPEKANECCPNTGPGWYYIWAYGGRGGRNLRDNIANRCANNEVIAIGEEYDTEQGVKYGPVDKGIQDLLDADPGATWNESCQCVVGSKYADWETSERVFAIPVFNPGRAFRSGRKPIEFSNFMAMFLESIENKGNKQNVKVRVLYATGIGGGDAESSGAKYPYLVE